MPKKTPRAEVVEAFSSSPNEPVVEVVAPLDPYVAPAEPPPRMESASGRSPHLDDAARQLTDLAELIANGRAVRESSLLADAAKRVTALRVTLGL